MLFALLLFRARKASRPFKELKILNEQGVELPREVADGPS